VVEAVCDATVPVIPPHGIASQIKNFFTALVKGDAEAREVIRYRGKAL